MYQSIGLVVACIVAFFNFTSTAPMKQSAPNQESNPQEQLVKLRTDLVTLDVLPVEKKTGRILSSLGRDDFMVFEDGVRQTISPCRCCF